MDLNLVPALIAGTVFLVIALLLGGGYARVRRQADRRRLLGKLRRDEAWWGGDSDAESLLRDERPGATGIREFFGGIGKRLALKKPEEVSGLRKTFLMAGLRGSNNPAVFYGVKFFLALLCPALYLVSGLFVVWTLSVNVSMAILLGSSLLGFYLPNLWLRNRIEKRKEKLFKAFPDALDLLVVCVEAGMGIDAAINRVGQEMVLSNRELSEEFKLLSLELKAGKSRQDALKNLAMRSDLEDVHNLVSLLIQTDRFGTSLGGALRIYSETFRAKRYTRAEEKAAVLTTKLMFPLIFFIFPALLVVLMGPAAVRFYEVLYKQF
jgi:tight adherence protein C